MVAVAACAPKAVVAPRPWLEVDDPRAWPTGSPPPPVVTAPTGNEPLHHPAAADVAPGLVGRLRLATVTKAGQRAWRLVPIVTTSRSPGARELRLDDLVVVVDGRQLTGPDHLGTVWAQLRRAGATASEVPETLLWLAVRPPRRVEPVYTRIGVAVKVGALGVGVDAALPIAPRANLRVGVSYLTYDRDYDYGDGIKTSGSLTLESFHAYLDWFAFGGGFHVSPGVMIYNGNRASGTAWVPAGATFFLDDLELVSSPDDPVTGTAVVTFERVAPALVIGWGNLVPRGRRRWSIPFELGVVYSRAPTTTLALRGTACDPDGDPCRDVEIEPLLQAAVLAESAKVDAGLSPYKVLPVLSIGFGYSF